MSDADEQLNRDLNDVGTKLLSPPPGLADLLSLLTLAENLLARVDQVPSASTCTALYPVMKALMAEELLHHSDMDVKISLAYCFSEITIITSPVDPYDEDFMKDMFRVIVDSLKDLDDVSSCTYDKKVLILENTAKVNSCRLMLDLECDDLILEMFQHFLTTIRPVNAQRVLSIMETIMTTVLNESEDNLISSLLDSMLKILKDALPISRRLGEKVIGNCAGKLKPYLINLTQSGGSFCDNHGDILASICQVNFGTSELNEIFTSGDCMSSGETNVPLKSSVDAIKIEEEDLSQTSTRRSARKATEMEVSEHHNSLSGQHAGDVLVEESLPMPNSEAQKDDTDLEDSSRTESRRKHTRGNNEAPLVAEDHTSLEESSTTESRRERCRGSNEQVHNNLEESSRTESRRRSIRGSNKVHILNEDHSKLADQSILEESSGTESRRKRTRSNNEVSEAEECKMELDEALIGLRIKVWWPDDKMFYKGKVSSFDPASKKHKVQYFDGDVELLLLKDERWELLKDKRKADGGRRHKKEISMPDSFPEREDRLVTKSLAPAALSHGQKDANNVSGGLSRPKGGGQRDVNNVSGGVSRPKTGGQKSANNVSGGVSRPKSGGQKDLNNVSGGVSRPKSGSSKPANLCIDKMFEEFKRKAKDRRTGQAMEVASLDTPESGERSEDSARKAGKFSKVIPGDEGNHAGEPQSDPDDSQESSALIARKRRRRV